MSERFFIGGVSTFQVGIKIVLHDENTILMLQYFSRFIFLSLFIVLQIPSTIHAQSCDDNTLGLLGMILNGNDDFPDEESGPSEPLIRTETLEFKYGFNFMIPKYVDELRSMGIEIALLKNLDKTKRLFLGSSFSYHVYGYQVYDTLIGDYDKVMTSNKIYGANFLAKFKVLELKFIQAYLGIQTGLLAFATRSQSIDDVLPCECGESPKTLHSMTTVRPNLGVFFGIQIPIFTFFDRLSIDIGHQRPGLTSYIRAEHVEIKPDEINYKPSIDNLNMINFQVGLSHYF